MYLCNAMIILCLFFILFYLARLRNLNFRVHRKSGEIRRNPEKSGEIRRNPEESGEIRGKYKIFHFELLTSTDIFHSLSLTLALTIVGHSNTRFYFFSGFLRIPVCSEIEVSEPRKISKTNIKGSYECYMY